MTDFAEMGDYVLLGHPVTHSLSPWLHQRLFTLRDRRATYTAVDLPAGTLPQALTVAFDRCRGLNVTSPYKETILPYLDDCCGRAAWYRSVNTVVIQRDGRRCGYNTDADGFRRALHMVGIPLTGRVVVWGCGGVGRMFACEAALAGCQVISVTRSPSRERAERLHRDVAVVAPGSHHVVMTAEEMERTDFPFDLLINATPVGMYPDVNGMAMSPATVARAAAVFDAVYCPIETALLRQAGQWDIRTVNGLSMLVWQAAEAHRLWFGEGFTDREIHTVIALAERELRRRYGGLNDET